METTKLVGKSEIYKDPIFDLLMNAENSVDMCTGLDPNFWNDKNVQSAIEYCVRKVLNFRILIDKETDIQKSKRKVSWIFKLRKEYPDTLKITKATEDIMHGIVIDEKVFLMQSHKIDKESDILKNLILKEPSRLIALQLLHNFNKRWNNAERDYDV